MKKVLYDDVKAQHYLKFLTRSQMATIYQLEDGRILKVFNPIYLMLDGNLEKKLLYGDNVPCDSVIIVPEEIVYNNDGSLVGFIMDPAKGISLVQWEKRLSMSDRCNLFLYADFYSKLEKAVRTTPNIVYPDLCTCDNIYVDSQESKVLGLQFIDYDGLQIDKFPSIAISSVLGNEAQYFSSEKYFQNSLFTKELDKKSLIMIYFLFTFNVNLNKIGVIEPFSQKKITLDDIFQILGLEDWDFMNKVWKIFQNDQANEYLGDDVFRIAEEYNMGAVASPLGNGYLKSLRPKR